MKVKTKIVYLNKIPFYTAESIKKSEHAFILFPEAFGMTGHSKDVAHRLAHLGFKVYLMNLYYAQVNDSDFSISYNDKLQREELVLKLNEKHILQDLSELNSYFSQYKSVNTLGFSIGGYFALAAASVLNIKNIFAYYPNPTINNKNYHLGSLEQYLMKVTCSVSLFFGGKDCSIPEDEIRVLQQFLPQDTSVVIYPQSSHGFFCNGRHVYNKNDAKDSWANILLKLNL